MIHRAYLLSAMLMTCLFVHASEDGSQYSDLDQINKRNIPSLALAFTHANGDLSQHFSRKGHSFQTVPIYWEGRLYFSTSSNLVLSIDASTGKEIWRFDPGLDAEVSYSESASRGVSLWHGETRFCPDRIFHGTLNGELYALDAKSGKPCKDFGLDGRIDLGSSIRNRRLGDYSVTSPVAILPDRIIVGSAIGDNGAVDLEQGIVRALDPVSGEQLWQWDPIPRKPDDPAASTWQGKSASITGAANAWAPISVDAERRLIFVPTSSPSPDFYGGERQGMNHYANSLVALHADTGKVVWFHQLVHHDIWDYDIPAEPSLTNIVKDDIQIPAVVVVTKTGMMFAFNRESGEPVYDIKERPVPASDVHGEKAHPTQPFSDITLVSTKAITEEDAFGLLLFDQQECREIIRKSRSEGIFTPPSLRGTIQFPGWPGGMNWGGVALDGDNQIAMTNFTNMPGLIRLLPRDEFNEAVRSNALPDWQLTAMTGTPYGMARRLFLSSLGLPCTKPPWGELAAVDLTTGETLWRKPIGTIEDLSPVPLPGTLSRLMFGDWGVPVLGGPLMTRGGLTFIGATLDYYFRAFDSHTGEELWRHRLPTSATSTPMSYLHNGRQYIAIAVGGHSGAGNPRDDKLMVFTLPD